MRLLLQERRIQLLETYFSDLANTRPARADDTFVINLITSLVVEK